MPVQSFLSVSDLHLDTHNFRTVPQRGQSAAIKSLIEVEGDRFWELLKSLVNDGFIPLESLAVLDDGGKMIVREGNRRLAAIKIILGIVKRVELRNDIPEIINSLTEENRKTLQKLPCLVYQKTEIDKVNDMVSRAHALGEKAGRSPWKALAKARYNRDVKGIESATLNLFESYLQKGSNSTDDQKARWAGNYPITVLEPLIAKLAQHFGYESNDEVVSNYLTRHKKMLDSILYDVGQNVLETRHLREDIATWGPKYGIVIPEVEKLRKPSDAVDVKTNGKSSDQGKPGKPVVVKARGRKALMPNNPRQAKAFLKKLSVCGERKEKVVALVAELAALDIAQTPIAFCLVLRTTLETLVNAYFRKHRKSTKNEKGRELSLEAKLKEAIKDLRRKKIEGGDDPLDARKFLQEAMPELTSEHSVLSIERLNGVVHHSGVVAIAEPLLASFFHLQPLLTELCGDD